MANRDASKVAMLMMRSSLSFFMANPDSVSLMTGRPIVMVEGVEEKIR